MNKLVVCLVGVFAATLIGAGSALSDCPWTFYPTGAQPLQVVIADFNNDGHQDLALTTGRFSKYGDVYFGHGVSVQLGNGSGGFQAPLSTASSLFGASHLVAADFDRDGFVDVAINGSVIGVFYGQGDGALQDSVGYAAGSGRGGIATADFNRDGIPDLAAANSSSNTISVILGLETGGFSPPIAYATGSHPDELAPGDFNEDGIVDLVVVNVLSSDISVFIGVESGGFAPEVRYPSGVYPRGVAIEDFDGDDILDLVVANTGVGTILLFKGGGSGGVGSGTFLAASPISGFGSPHSVEFSDFNVDGAADIVVADYEGYVRVVLGVGNGAIDSLVSIPLSESAADVAVGDFNGDLRPDLAVPNSGGLAIAIALGCHEVLTLSPSSGASGTVVTIGGRNFIDVVSVQFNGAEAEFSALSDSVIVATVPEAARTGPVTVRDVHGIATGPIFTIAPRILSFSPGQAPIGFGPVRIRGHSLGGATDVLFNGVSAAFSVNHDELIEATVPGGASDGPLTVIGPGGTGVSDRVFRIGPLGGGVNLSWDNCGTLGSDLKSFACNSNSGAPFVLIGSFSPPFEVDFVQGFAAELRIESSGALPDWWKHGVCRTQEALAASADFSGGPSGCVNEFSGMNTNVSYLPGHPNPNTARVIINVTSLFNQGPLLPDLEYYAFRLEFGRSQSTGAGSCSGCNTPVRVSLESLRLGAPAGLPSIPILTQPLVRNVAYWQAVPLGVPEVHSFSPIGGVVGAPVTLLGRNFSAVTLVRFNSLAADFTVVSDSVIATQVPAGARSGPISVTSLDGSGVSPDAFIVAPTISSFEPMQAPVGTSILLQGVNFTATSAVSFNGVPATFTLQSDTRISADVPKGATDGPITVQNPGGSDTTDNDFRVGPRIAGGINLSWVDCGASGLSNQTFACNVNTGAPFAAVASFAPLTTLPEFLGVSADVRILSSVGPLPDWWKHGAGQCRGTTGLTTSFDFTTGPFSCADFNGGQAAGGFAYDVGFQSPENARLRIQYAVPFENRGPVAPGTEYYAFKINALRSKTTGTGACLGCDVPMCIRLNSIQLFQPPERDDDPVLFEPLSNNVVSWQSPAINCLLATPVLVSVVTAEATADRVRLVWQTEDVERASVHRRDADGVWRRVASIYADGQGRITYEDAEVTPGATYDYRLGIPAPAGEVFVGETRVAVPAAAPAVLSLARVAWNGSALAVSLSLPRSGTAQLELFDVNGRRLAEERLEGLAAGEHDLHVRPAQPLRPGVFFARLTQDHEHAGRRFVVLR